MAAEFDPPVWNLGYPYFRPYGIWIGTTTDASPFLIPPALHYDVPERGAFVSAAHVRIEPWKYLLFD